MLKNTKIFQIYYKPELLQHCDPAFEPLDNTANPRPDLREWYNWEQEYEKLINSDLEYWGFVSWKFKEKTNLTGQQVLDWIEKNPGHDVYLINPCIVNEALFVNSWEQGDIWHPNISDIGNKFLQKLGYTDVDVRALFLDRNKIVFANYIIGNRKFWTEFMQFSRSLFTEAEKDATFKDEVFGIGKSQYVHDRSLPNFTFLIERLIPTFLELKEFDSLGYTYENLESVHQKYHPYYAEIREISNLKILVNQYDSDELYHTWDFFRKKMLQQYPGILGLE